MTAGTMKHAAVAASTFAVTYIGFNLLCLLSWLLNEAVEPVPALITGIPIGTAAAINALFFSLFWTRRSDPTARSSPDDDATQEADLG